VKADLCCGTAYSMYDIDIGQVNTLQGTWWPKTWNNQVRWLYKNDYCKSSWRFHRHYIPHSRLLCCAHMCNNYALLARNSPRVLRFAQHCGIL